MVAEAYEIKDYMRQKNLNHLEKANWVRPFLTRPTKKE